MRKTRAQTAFARLLIMSLAIACCVSACGGFAIERPWGAGGPKASAPVVTYGYETWSEAEAPEYYRVVGSAQIDVELGPGEARYAPLDQRGRAGQAAACVSFEMMEAGRAREREDMSSLHPSGWGHNDEVDIELPTGDTYHGMFWNRSHLIAKSLGGTDEVENLVTGTRMQNVGSNSGKHAGGMAFCETQARDWLEEHPDGSLLYVATPVYEGDELVCRSVIVDMRTSDGSIDQRVEVFNAAKGYEIDYATGEFRQAG